MDTLNKDKKIIINEIENLELSNNRAVYIQIHIYFYHI